MKRAFLFFAVLFLGSVSTGLSKTFDAPIRLKVYAKGSGDTPDRWLGYTPSSKKKPITLPGGVWFVRPEGPLAGAQIHQLADVLVDNKVLGVDLSNRWDITDETLTIIGRCDSLRYLNISHTKVTDTGLESLSRFPYLQSLVVSQNITNKGAEYLTGLQYLEDLDLSGSRVTDAGMVFLKGVPRLKTLLLANTHITDAGLSVLKENKRLQTLVVGNGVSDGGVKTLVELKALVSLDASASVITDWGWKRLAPLKRLKAVYLNPEAGDAALKALGQIEGLEILDLTGTHVTDAGMAYLAGLSHLKEVALTRTAVSDKGVAYLAKNRSLRVLELSNTRVTPAAVTLMAKNHPKLEALSLPWGRLSSQDLDQMASMKSLVTVVLNGVPMPKSVMKHLQAMAALRQKDRNKPRDLVSVENQARQKLSSHDRRRIAEPTPALVSKPLPRGLTSPSPSMELIEEPADVLAETPKLAATSLTSSETSAVAPPLLVSNNAGAASSGLRRLRYVEAEGSSLTDLQVPGNAHIASQEYKPENSLGEFSVGAEKEKP